MLPILSNKILISLEMKEQSLQDIEASLKAYVPDSINNVTILEISIGIFLAMTCSILFARIVQSKLKEEENQTISTIPFKTSRTMIIWTIFFLGLSLIFAGILQLFGFSGIAPLIISILISLISGIPMWTAVNDLFAEIESGTIREIDEYL